METIKHLQELIKSRHENAIADSLASFVGFFILIVGAVILFILIIKFIPWFVEKTGSSLYKLFTHSKEEEERETYHHIDRPLKKLDS